MSMTMASRETSYEWLPRWQPRHAWLVRSEYGRHNLRGALTSCEPTLRLVGISDRVASGARGSPTTGKRRYRALPLTGRTLVCGLKCQPFPLLDEFGDLAGEAVSHRITNHCRADNQQSRFRSLFGPRRPRVATPARPPGASRDGRAMLGPRYPGLQTVRHLHACPGCFRGERSPGGPCTH